MSEKTQSLKGGCSFRAEFSPIGDGRPSAVTMGAFMNINRRHISVAAFACAIALLLQIAHLGAKGRHQPNNPLEITFTKWITPPPVVVNGTAGIPEGRLFMAGLVDGDVPGGAYVGEVLHRQQTANPALKAVIAKL